MAATLEKRSIPKMRITDEAPAIGSITITPHNTNVQEGRSLYVGVGGDVKVRMYDGTDALFKNVPTGTLLPIVFDRVYATDTNATTMIGLI